MIYQIYTLSDKRVEEEIMYVGLTTQKLTNRLSNHFYESQKINIDKYEWLHSVGKENILIKKLIEVEDKETALTIERCITKFFRIKYPKLLNRKNGNDNSHLIGRIHTMPEASRLKLSVLNSGEKSCRARLKEFQVIDIIKKSKLGFTNHELAIEFQVSYEHIINIIKGYRWKHISR